MTNEKDISDLTVDPDLKKGFNAGYLLAEHQPEKLQTLLKEAKKETLLSKGLRTGQKQFKKDQLLLQQQNKKQDRDNER